MEREQGWQVVDERRVLVADLLETLTPEEWATPSLCRGWTVRDVAAHLSMAATSTLGEVAGHLARARGSFDRMIRDSAVERAARPTDRIVEDLRDIVGSRKLAPTTFWRDPLLDVLVHGEDIALPLGRTLPPHPEAARTAVEWAWARRFPFFPARRLRGARLVADDVEWARGRGEELRGPVTSLLLLSTGRPAGLAGVTGPGADVVRPRLTGQRLQ